MLKKIGRIHNYEEFLETYNLARQVGFKNINVDLMIGLPSQSIQNIKESLNKIINLNPEHISVYSLILEEGTKLYQKYQNNDIELPDEETERNMYWYVKNTLELNGYKHYEISNYEEAARIIKEKRELNLTGGVLITNPIPAQYEMNKVIIDNAIEDALKEMDELGIKGKESTPFLLKRITELTGGDSLESNIELVLNNARVGANIAKEYSKL